MLKGFLIFQKKHTIMTFKPLLTLAVIVLFTCTSFAQFGFNSTGATPNNSAMVDIVSTSKGLLIPRMTTAERTAISTPATGLLVFDSMLNSFYFYNGSTWSAMLITESDPKVGNLTNNYLPKWNGTNLENGQLFDNNTNIGLGTISPIEKFHLSGGNLLVQGSLATSPTLSVSGAGTRMFFYPKKGAFRAGGVNSGDWNDVNIGNYSTAFGLDAAAIGTNSFAVGPYANAEGVNSFSLGLGAWTTGLNSFAIGNSTWAEGEKSLAIGASAHSIGISSIALGNAAFAAKNYAVAIGSGSSAHGENSITLGSNITASSYAEVALGSYGTNHTINSSAAWNTNDRILTVGNGASDNSRSDALVILKNGNTGIGATIPTEKLEVVGKTKTTNLQMTYGATSGYFLQSDASGNASWVANTASADNLGNHTATQNINIGANYLSNGNTNYGLQLNTSGDVTITGGSNSSNLLNIGDATNSTSVVSFKSSTQKWRMGVGDGLGDSFTVTDETNDETPLVIGNNNESNTLRLNNSKVGINNSNPVETLDVSGKTKTTTFQMTDGAINGRILKSDASGNASWSSLSLLETDPQVSSSTTNYIPRWNGASLVDGSIYDDGTQTGVGTATISVDSRLAIGALNATEGGQFQLNSGSARTVAYFMDNYDDKLRIMSGTNSASVTHHFTMNSSGNIGLGTFTPTEKLDVRGKTKTETFQMTETAVNGYILTSDANGNGTWASPQSSTSWTVSNTNLYNALAGNVGIGISTPTSKLHVSGSTTLAGQVNFNDNWNIQTGADFWLEKNGTRYLTMYGSGGNMGLGTSTPTSSLHINGTLATKFKTPLVAGTTSPDGTAMTWRYTSGTGTITLPTASSCPDRIYVIINQTGSTRTISQYRDLATNILTTLNSSVSLWLQSDGSEWFQIK
jgi:hypothetical protein